MAIANLLSSAISYHHELTFTTFYHGFANPAGPKASLTPGENDQRRCIEAESSKSYHLRLLEADGQQLLPSLRLGQAKAALAALTLCVAAPNKVLHVLVEDAMAILILFIPTNLSLWKYMVRPSFPSFKLPMYHRSAALAIPIPTSGGTFSSTVLVGPQCHRSTGVSRSAVTEVDPRTADAISEPPGSRSQGQASNHGARSSPNEHGCFL